MTRRPILALSILALDACGASSGIVPIGPDTYGLTEMRAEAAGGGERAREAVLAEAAGFCQQQGRAMVLLNLLPGGDPRGYYWPTAYGATFQCGVVSLAASPAAHS